MAGTFQGDARARELHALGWSCNRIAKELGVGAATISRWAKREGLSFDRAQVAVANQARAVDGKARRLSITERLYRRAEALLDRLEAPTFKTMQRAEGGGERAAELDFVPTQNERDLAQSIATHLTSAAKLEAVDSDSGVSSQKSLLAELGRALGITQPVDNPPS